MEFIAPSRVMAIADAAAAYCIAVSGVVFVIFSIKFFEFPALPDGGEPVIEQFDEIVTLFFCNADVELFVNRDSGDYLILEYFRDSVPVRIDYHEIHLLRYKVGPAVEASLRRYYFGISQLMGVEQPEQFICIA